jgi:hypothetical protein
MVLWAVAPAPPPLEAVPSLVLAVPPLPPPPVAQNLIVSTPAGIVLLPLCVYISEPITLPVATPPGPKYCITTVPFPPAPPIIEQAP